jgi:hypothetical protein
MIHFWLNLLLNLVQTVVVVVLLAMDFWNCRVSLCLCVIVCSR